jgi:hypothetical protein
MCFFLRKFIVDLQGVKPVDMKLEVVVLGVSNLDRAKAFWQRPNHLM